MMKWSTPTPATRASRSDPRLLRMSTCRGWSSRVAARKGRLKTMAEPDRQAQSRMAGVRAVGRAPVPHHQTRLRVHQDQVRRDREEPQPPPRAFRFSELVDAGPCRSPDGVTAYRKRAQNRPNRAGTGQAGRSRRPEGPKPLPGSCSALQRAMTPDNQRFPSRGSRRTVVSRRAPAGVRRGARADRQGRRNSDRTSSHRRDHGQPAATRVRSRSECWCPTRWSR